MTAKEVKRAINVGLQHSQSARMTIDTLVALCEVTIIKDVDKGLFVRCSDKILII